MIQTHIHIFFPLAFLSFCSDCILTYSWREKIWGGGGGSQMFHLTGQWWADGGWIRGLPKCPSFLFKQACVSELREDEGTEGVAAVRRHSHLAEKLLREKLCRGEPKIKSYQSREERKKREDKQKCWHHVGIRDGALAVAGRCGSGSRWETFTVGCWLKVAAFILLG